MNKTTCQELLRYDFSEAEIKEKSAELARVCQEKKQVEDEKKQVVSDFKAKIDNKDAKIHLLSNNINNGYEFRPVDCKILFNMPVNGQKTILRIDTGEIVRVDFMSEYEKQEQFQFEQEV